MTSFTTRPEIAGSFGAVSSTHWLASASGMAMLERGGNAFDAAVAAGLVLQVVEPHNNGPGGEVPIILCRGGGHEVKVICGQGGAPGAATIEVFEDLGLDLVPGIGLLPAVVPGAFGAWLLLLERYGTLSLREVLTPAIGYAENGYPIPPGACLAIGGVKRLFEEEWRSSAELYLPGGAVPAPGSAFRNRALARTYARVLREAEAAGGDRERQIEAARECWYRGFVAERIGAFCRDSEAMDTSGRRHRGLLTADDMAVWAPTEESPVALDYGDYTVFKTGPWGQGPVFLQQLALLEGFDLGDAAPASAELVHTITECAKLAFADRDAYYGDPAFVDVPLETLLSGEYNAARRALIGRDASHEWRPGELPGFEVALTPRAPGSAVVSAFADALELGEPTEAQFAAEAASLRAGGGDTCHVNAIDADGNMVAATPSGGWLQASPTIPELGWNLSGRGEMFWLDGRIPSALAPRKRPRTTLTPSLAFRGGEPYMVFGTPGGDQQDQWTLHAFLRHVHHGMDLQQAIDAPEFHTKHLVDSFFPRECQLGHLALEGRFRRDVIAELERRGHHVDVHGDWSLGFVCASAKDGWIRSAASPRFMRAYAVGR